MAASVDPMNVPGAAIWPPGEAPAEGPSKVEQLLRHFEDHEDKERKTLEEYRETIKRTVNPMVKFVLDLIRLDEEKHYDVVNAMLSTVQKNVLWRNPPGALDLFQGVGADREALLALVKKFAQLEREGIKEYESLIGETKDYYEGLFAVLLRGLIKDSEKHLMFLEFLQKYLNAAHP